MRTTLDETWINEPRSECGQEICIHAQRTSTSHDSLRARGLEGIRNQDETDLSAAQEPIGRERTRRRPSLKTTIEPWARWGSSVAKLASRIRRRWSLRRDVGSRKRITEGWESRRWARIVPKSVSAAITTRCSRSASAKIVSSVAAASPREATCTAS